MIDPTKMNTAIGKLIYDYFSPAVKVYGKSWGEKVALKKKANLELIREKIEKKIEESVIEERELSMKFLVPYIEFAALEDDDYLQDMWANLFVNYVDLNKKLNTTVYPDILRQLSSDEVRILINLSNGSTPLKGMNDHYGVPKELIAKSIPNLNRLGLIDNLKGAAIGNRITDEDIKYFLTSFGLNFISACTRETKGKNKTKKSK